MKRFVSYKKKGAWGAPRGARGCESNPRATAKYLIIVESPSKCAKIEKYMGSDYACIASKGHLRYLNSLKNIHLETYDILFENIAAKTGHIAWMREMIRRFDKSRIILASDNDREGEAIAWHICTLFDLPVSSTQRIVFSEITEDAIRQAVAAPTVINMNLVYAQHARQILDVLVGFQISPLLWKYLFFDKSKEHALSAGRCQTPALRLVHDRAGAGADQGLQYKMMAWFFPKNVRFALNVAMDTGDQVREFMELSQTHNHCMTIGDSVRKVYPAPAPFNTSRLLQTASNCLHISPSETMRICQTLYQDGWITYMRTESKKYCKEFLEKALVYVAGEYSEKHVGSLEKIQNDEKFPHEGVRVTNLSIKKESLMGGSYESRTLAVYHLIWTNTLQSCMAAAEYTNIKLAMTAPKGLLYTHILETPVFLGWRQTKGWGINDCEETSEGSPALMFYLKSRGLTGVPLERIESAVTVTGGHTHYSESALIQRLEDLGIGRPSTYSSIIETIQDRAYVKKCDIEGTEFDFIEYKMSNERGGWSITETGGKRRFGNEKGKLVIQPLGQIVVDFLVDHFDTIFSYDYTSRMETDLDEIARGSVKYADVCRKYNDELVSLIGRVKKGIKKKVYVIDDQHTLMFEKYGPVICKTTRDVSGQELPVGQIRPGGPGGPGRSTKSSREIKEYFSVNREITIDLEKLKAQTYTISELLEPKVDLGEHEGNPILVKHGPYGDYIECGDKKYSLKDYKGNPSNLTRSYVLGGVMGVGSHEGGGTGDVITRHVSKNAVLRKFTEHLCIKNGRYGAYAFYDLADGKKPQFFNIKKFDGDWRVCPTGDFMEWFRTKYGVS